MRSDGPTPDVGTAVSWEGSCGDGVGWAGRLEACGGKRRVLAGPLGTEAAQCPLCVGREGGRLRKLL